MLEGLLHSLIVLPGRHLTVSAPQLAGHLEAFFGGHLPSSQQVPFVCHQKQGNVGIGVDLADVLVQGPDEPVAVVVRDGVYKHEAVCPVD